MKNFNFDEVKFQDGEMSINEKMVLLQIYSVAPELPYKANTKVGKDGVTYSYYDIPAEDRQKILDKLNPFEANLSIDDEMYCLHERKKFKVGDYYVIRYANRNMLVSPYFFESGGMVVDWVNELEELPSVNVRKVK